MPKTILRSRPRVFYFSDRELEILFSKYESILRSRPRVFIFSDRELEILFSRKAKLILRSRPRVFIFSDRELEIFIQLDMWRSRKFELLRLIFSRNASWFSDQDLESLFYFFFFLIVSLRCLSSLAAPHGEIPNFEVFIVRTWAWAYLFLI